MRETYSEILYQLIQAKFGKDSYCWKLDLQDRSTMKSEAMKIFANQFDEKMKEKLLKYREVIDQVSKLDDEAAEKIDEATKLLRESGLGYFFSVSPLDQAYATSHNRLCKFFEIENIDDIQDIIDDLEIQITSHGWEGWTHSSLC